MGSRQGLWKLSPVCVFFLCGVTVALRLASAELAFRNQQPRRALAILGSTPNAIYTEAALGEGVALGVNPRFTQARIRLGLAHEVDGDVSSAERTLLEAAQYDRQYLPAWTLANFYFRRERREDFWMWAREAARLSFDDPKPLLRLASTMEKNPEIVLDRLKGPGNGKNRLAYSHLDVLIQNQRLDSAQELARVLLKGPAPDEERMEALAARQDAAQHIAWAREIRNALKTKATRQ